MTLKEYLETASGISILSSADGDGMVSAAIYSTPHVFDDGTVAFIMRNKLTHRNLLTNPYASYMLIERGDGYKGIRLFLKKIKEDDDAGLIKQLTRRHLSPEEDKARGRKFIVYFRVDKILPLIGDADAQIQLK